MTGGPECTAVSLRGVSHAYPGGGDGRRARWALRDVSLDVAEGEILGLLGPNGAGKTTTVKILSTLLVPTEGSVLVLGRDAVGDPHHIRRDIGLVLGGDRGLYDRLSGYDNLRYFAELYGISGRAGARRIAEVLEIVGLTGDERVRVERYSRGMRQRLHMARGILHRPRLLLLDEPSIGVDPVGARQLRDLVREVNRGGTTVILTTHYMYEAEELASRLAIMSAGQVLAFGTVGEIRATARLGTIVEGLAAGLAEHELARIRHHPATDGLDVSVQGGRQRLTISLADGAGVEADGLLDLLGALGVEAVARRDATLEDAYVQIVTAGPAEPADRA
jgi:ABC-2 type transport system ATP-binding protein